ncbi:MAG TPA: hypothetical protein VK574_06840 [Terracidiphilus sp.]|nr:hypothetical protein [Terracidiphilus sp.]
MLPFTEICLETIKEYILGTMLFVVLTIDVAAIVVLARRDVFKAFSVEGDDTQMLWM